MGVDLTENKSKIFECYKSFLPPKRGVLNLLSRKTIFWFRKICISGFPPVAPEKDVCTAG